jgi:hypothetical protein
MEVICINERWVLETPLGFKMKPPFYPKKNEICFVTSELKASDGLYYVLRGYPESCTYSSKGFVPIEKLGSDGEMAKECTEPVKIKKPEFAEA